MTALVFLIPVANVLTTLLQTAFSRGRAHLSTAQKEYQILRSSSGLGDTTIPLMKICKVFRATSLLWFYAHPATSALLWLPRGLPTERPWPGQWAHILGNTGQFHTLELITKLAFWFYLSLSVSRGNTGLSSWDVRFLSLTTSLQTVLISRRSRCLVGVAVPSWHPLVLPPLPSLCNVYFPNWRESFLIPHKFYKDFHSISWKSVVKFRMNDSENFNVSLRGCCYNEQYFPMRIIFLPF